MAKMFTYTTKATPEDIFKTLSRKLKQASSINLSGDERSGKIDGSGFRGSYKITEVGSATRISITISEKPFLVPWGMVKSEMDKMAKEWQLI